MLQSFTKIIDGPGNVAIGVRARLGMVTFVVNEETPVALTPEEASRLARALNTFALDAIDQEARRCSDCGSYVDNADQHHLAHVNGNGRAPDRKALMA